MKTYKNMFRNEANMYEKTVPKLNQERCLKTDAKQITNTEKMTPKSVPKDEFISRVAPLGASLVAQTAFGHQKLAPSAAKVPPIIKKINNETCAWTPNNVFLLTTVVGSLSSKLECSQYPDH